jgi:hypothetical protein
MSQDLTQSVRQCIQLRQGLRDRRIDVLSPEKEEEIRIF